MLNINVGFKITLSIFPTSPRPISIIKKQKQFLPRLHGFLSHITYSVHMRMCGDIDPRERSSSVCGYIYVSLLHKIHFTITRRYYSPSSLLVTLQISFSLRDIAIS